MKLKNFMKFKDFELTEDNHFVAMQYYGFIFNRTYLVILMNEKIIGIKMNGLISVESTSDPLINAVVRPIAVRGDLQNPYSYLKTKYIEIAQEYNLLDDSILNKNKSNFIIQRSDIKSVRYDSSKKWGMGYYPHDGKVYIVTNNGMKKELIILGSQSGARIANLM